MKNVIKAVLAIAVLASAATAGTQWNVDVMKGYKADTSAAAAGLPAALMAATGLAQTQKGFAIGDMPVYDALAKIFELAQVPTPADLLGWHKGMTYFYSEIRPVVLVSQYGPARPDVPANGLFDIPPDALQSTLVWYSEPMNVGNIAALAKTPPCPTTVFTANGAEYTYQLQQHTIRKYNKFLIAKTISAYTDDPLGLHVVTNVRYSYLEAMPTPQ